jgi:hypothetical protein
MRYRQTVANICFRALPVILACSCAAFCAGPYPLRVASDGRHLIDQAGTPFLIHGDTAWSLLTGLTKEDAEQYLVNRSRKGFNSIIVNLIEHKFNGPVNRYNDAPFTTMGDFTTPNEKYFEHADWVIRKAGELGIQVFLAPIYLGYIGTDEGWMEETLANGPEKCRAWGRFVGARYRKFDNVVWLIGGDRDPGNALESINAVVAGIKQSGDRHLFTAHCHPEHSPVEQYTGGWLDVNTTYTYQIVHSRLLADYHRTPVMPFVLIESTYEGEHNASEVQIRRQAYWAVLCGATGQFLGNRPIWLFDNGWKSAMDASGSLDMARLRKLFMSRPWYDLVPDDRHEVVVDGLGEFTGLDYLAAARTKDESTMIAYLPTARTITVDMGKLRGKFARAWWFEPHTGRSSRLGEFPTAGKRRFTPPAAGDWVLVLDDASRNLPVPGADKGD